MFEYPTSLTACLLRMHNYLPPHIQISNYAATVDDELFNITP